MISGYLIGDKELVARFRALPAEFKKDLDQTVQKLGYQLEANIKQNYLSGQVFKRVTGKLASSITHGDPNTRSRFVSTSNSSVYYVGTNVSYAKPLFYGHSGYTVRPINAKALRFTVNGGVVFAMSAKIPPKAGKNVLVMALNAMKPMIVTELEQSLQRTAKRVLSNR